MIAIGTPFIDLLTKSELNLTQYCVLYCYAYNKVYLLEEYFRNNRQEIKYMNFLFEQNYLQTNAAKPTLVDIFPTHKCISYIKDLVDSYDDIKAENILADDSLFDLTDDIYKEEFNLFHESYPVSVIRKNGTKSMLRENKKQCKELYIQTLTDKKIKASELQKCLLFYIEEKTKRGDIAFLKTMRNFLKDETWRDVKEYMDNNNNNKDVDYGGKLI